MIAEFFQPEADEIEELEAKLNELESELAEVVETAQEVAGYEPDEDEKVTPTKIKQALKGLIDDLKDAEGKSAKEELAKLKEQDSAIKKVEKKIKEVKSKLKVKRSELEDKILMKRIGDEEFKSENLELIKQVEHEISELNPDNEEDKKKINALKKDKVAIELRIEKTEAMYEEIGGQITAEQAKNLILKKLYDIANAELKRYLNTELRYLIASIENLWNKYAVSNQELEKSRDITFGKLNDFLKGLGYV